MVPFSDMPNHRRDATQKASNRGFISAAKEYQAGEELVLDYGLLNDEQLELTLDDADPKAVLVPPYHVNAHLCLSRTCVFYYKMSEYYAGPEEQWSVRFDDPRINAQWPSRPILLSARDLQAGALASAQELARG